VTTKSILDRYGTLLLDMNGTFMFEQDRFGPHQNYHATYRELGGETLAVEKVQSAVSACVYRMAAIYEDSSCHDSFPSVLNVLNTLPECSDIRHEDVEILEATIALHERGTVPPAYAAALKQLATTHRLGLVTNIWSRKSLWLREFERVEIDEIFSAAVFSSDYQSVKPSPVLFERALALMNVPHKSALYVGDSLRCDIDGASAAGLDSLWLNPDGVDQSPTLPVPNFQMRSLLDLV
jgi:putative hydrolase of the HAD superfamily